MLGFFHFMSSVTNEKVRSVGKAEGAAEMEMCGRKRKNDAYMNSEDNRSSDIRSDNSSLVQRKGAFLLFCASCTSKHW